MDMDYEHDVFISYKRSPIQNEWIREHFMLLFLEFVRDEIMSLSFQQALSRTI
jgi:hypothetical protein